MKKYFLISLFLSLSLSLFATEQVKGYMIQKDGPLYVQNIDGDMVWTLALDEGTEVQIITVKEENGKKVNEVKKAKRISGNKKIDGEFIHILVKGQEFWTLKERISIGQTPGVITSDCAFYRSCDIADPYDISLSTGTLITKGDSYSGNVNNVSFCAVTYFDNTNFVTRRGYILSDKVSVSKDDLTALSILKKISESKDDIVKTELLKNLNSLRLSNGIQEMFNSVKGEIMSGDLTSGGFDQVEAYMTVVNNDTSSYINIRSLPGIKGDVLGQISDISTTVYVTKKTKLKSKVGESENFWYEIETEDEQLKGWIFGDFIHSL